MDGLYCNHALTKAPFVSSTLSKGGFTAPQRKLRGFFSGQVYARESVIA